jgi:hypothetical protein
VLVPDKDPDIIAASKLIADAHAAAEAENYERATALAALAQAHVAVSRHEAFVDGADDVREQLTNISGALVAQGPL